MNVTFKTYLTMQWTIAVTQSGDEAEPYTASIVELPGCMTHGTNPTEAIKNLSEAHESYITSLVEGLKG